MQTQLPRGSSNERNLDLPGYVSASIGRGATTEGLMTLWKKFFSRKPPQRVRVCVECGMPIAEHKDWCSILRTQRELAQKGVSLQK